MLTTTPLFILLRGGGPRLGKQNSFQQNCLLPFLTPMKQTMSYDLPLDAGIMPRLVVTIVGQPLPLAKGFEVDFIKGPDIAFHFNPQFNEGIIVRNSFLGGHWGQDEQYGRFPFPFIRGQRFELKILVERNMFKVEVDGAHLLEYKHRVTGLEKVTLLRVVGDVFISSIVPSMI